MARKAGNTAKEAIKEEIKLSLTPMIDVTFLLLIFFMCNIKFKLLEGKLAAYLPKDKGVNQTDTMLMTEEIRILLQKKLGKTEFFIFGRKVAGKIPDDLGKLYSTVKNMYASLSRAQEKVPSVIQVEDQVRHGDVVACLNEMLRAGLRDITFTQTTASNKPASSSKK